MTIIEAINTIDTLKPNSYPKANKVRWLSELDGIIKTEIIDTHEGSETIIFNGYTDATADSTQLLVSAPYDDVYIKWLEAKIDYTNAEYGKYNNSVTAYNTAYSAFERYYNRTHMPITRKIKYFGVIKSPEYQATNAVAKVIVEED